VQVRQKSGQDLQKFIPFGSSIVPAGHATAGAPGVVGFCMHWRDEAT